MSGYAQTEETPRKTLGFSGICQIAYVRAYGGCRFFADEDDIRWYPTDCVCPGIRPAQSHHRHHDFPYTPYTTIPLMRPRIRHGMACQLRAEQFTYRFLQWMHMCSACHRHHGTTGVI